MELKEEIGQIVGDEINGAVVDALIMAAKFVAKCPIEYEWGVPKK